MCMSISATQHYTPQSSNEILPNRLMNTQSLMSALEAERAEKGSPLEIE